MGPALWVWLWVDPNVTVYSAPPALHKPHVVPHVAQKSKHCQWKMSSFFLPANRSVKDGKKKGKIQGERKVWYNLLQRISSGYCVLLTGIVFRGARWGWRHQRSHGRSLLHWMKRLQVTLMWRSKYMCVCVHQHAHWLVPQDRASCKQQLPSQPHPLALTLPFMQLKDGADLRMRLLPYRNLYPFLQHSKGEDPAQEAAWQGFRVGGGNHFRKETEARKGVPGSVGGGGWVLSCQLTVILLRKSLSTVYNKGTSKQR